MGSFLAKLAGHNDEKEAAESLKNPHNIVAYTLFFGFIACVLLLWIVIAILTTVRIYKKRKRRSKDCETETKSTLDLQLGKKILRTTLDLQVRKKILNNLRRRQSEQRAEIETVEIITTPGSAGENSTKLGIQLVEGQKTDGNSEGVPGIFVANVRRKSIAEGKLFPGDKILAINDFYLGKASLKYAMEVMHALKQAEGHLKFSVKRAQQREQRVNEAFSMYCDDEDTGKKVVFTKEHMEVFEEAFSMFDVNATGKIQFKFLFPLLRNLGYNIHKAEAWDYLNELELADKPTITFSEVIKFLEEIVADQQEKTEVTCVYNVFDPEQKGHVPVSEIQEALHIWYGKKITEEEVQEIVDFADHDNNGFVKDEDFERLLLPSLTLY
ncbi:uncharacterized protein LOC144657100 isoform X1 [Oculina patagonica]